jgi:hypothetical protein
MEAVMALDEIDPACETPQADKKTRVRIDWKRGAALLVAGETPDAVAAALGITQDRLWRHLRSSLRFQFLLRQARETQLLLGRLKLEAVANAAAIRCAEQAEKPPASLFEQFKTTSQPAWAPPCSGDMVHRLAESLRRAPKRRPRPVRPAAKAPDKGEISENKTHISENKTQISPDKMPASLEKVLAGADKALAVADKFLKQQAAEPPAPPSAAPPPPSRRPPFGAQLGPHGETIQHIDGLGRAFADVAPIPDRRGRSEMKGPHPDPLPQAGEGGTRAAGG